MSVQALVDAAKNVLPPDVGVSWGATDKRLSATLPAVESMLAKQKVCDHRHARAGTMPDGNIQTAYCPTCGADLRGDGFPTEQVRASMKAYAKSDELRSVMEGEK